MTNSKPDRIKRRVAAAAAQIVCGKAGGNYRALHVDVRKKGHHEKVNCRQKKRGEGEREQTRITFLQHAKEREKILDLCGGLFSEATLATTVYTHSKSIMMGIWFWFGHGQ